MYKRHLQELKRITDSIPEELMGTLMEERLVAPTVKEVVQRALTDDDIAPHKKERLGRLLESGILDKTVSVVNEEKEKAIDTWVEQEIEKSVRAGRLPDPKKDPQFHLFNKKKKKWITKNIRKDLSRS